MSNCEFCSDTTPRLAHAERPCAQSVQAAISTEKKITQPGGAAVPEEADTRHEACIRFLRLFFRWRFRWQHKNTLGPREGSPSVSPCEPLCAIFLRKPSVLPAFGSGSEREPFVREVEKRVEERLEIKFMAVASPDFSHLLI